MTHQPSRRAFIAGASLLALSPVAAHAATAGGAHGTPSPNPRLHRAIALHQRAVAEYERFDVEVHSPALQAFAADIAAYPREPEPPHEQVATTFINWEEKEIRLSTVNVGFKAAAEGIVNDPRWADADHDDWRQAHHELHALHQRRDAVIAGQAERSAAYRAEARERHRLEKLDARATALSTRSCKLWDTVLATPAHGLPDMAAKIAFIEKHDDEPGEYEFAALAADIKRLARGEG